MNNTIIVGKNIGQAKTFDLLNSIFQDFEKELEIKKLTWNDISLIKVFNCAVSDSYDEINQYILNSINHLSSKNNHFPSLIGSSAVSGFYKSGNKWEYKLNNGIIIVGYYNSIYKSLPVTLQIKESNEFKEDSAISIIDKCLQENCRMLSENYDFDITIHDLISASTGLLFTSGVGYIEKNEFVDFRTPYTVAQEVIKKYPEFNIIGGCASNRTSEQLQVVYYSKKIGNKTTYHYSYKHTAVFVMFPFSLCRQILEHPYELAEEKNIQVSLIDFDNYDYKRHFYIDKIENIDSLQYFSKKWNIPVSELENFEEAEKALAADIRTFTYTIGSAKTAFGERIWPNIPSRVKTVNNSKCIRIIRAEPVDSNFYLLKLVKEKLDENFKQFHKSYLNLINRKSFQCIFLCESRFYLGENENLSDTKKEFVLANDNESEKLGIYLNGEFSFGNRESVGYHNFSFIGGLFTYKEEKDLPFKLYKQLLIKSKFRIFLSHSSRDKGIVHEIKTNIDSDLKSNIVSWIDEDELKLGQSLSRKIENAIINQADFFVIFISKFSIQSDWVKKELLIGLRKEQELNRTFIIPVLIDDVWDELQTVWSDLNLELFSDKLYLNISDFSKDSLMFFTNKLSSNLRELIIEEA